MWYRKILNSKIWSSEFILTIEALFFIAEHSILYLKQFLQKKIVFKEQNVMALRIIVNVVTIKNLINFIWQIKRLE